MKPTSKKKIYVPVVTSLTLSEQRSLASLVLGDFVGSVLLAGLTLAVSVTGLGNVDL
jgi:hypothetical protein